MRSAAESAGPGWPSGSVAVFLPEVETSLFEEVTNSEARRQIGLCAMSLKAQGAREFSGSYKHHASNILLETWSAGKRESYAGNCFCSVHWFRRDQAMPQWLDTTLRLLCWLWRGRP